MKVLICGAGIAGLALALRLHQRGLDAVVIERAPALRDGGYMLGLSDPGLDAAERMGIAGELLAARYLPRRLVYLRDDGRERFAIEEPALNRLVGRRQVGLMRGDIERVLHARVGDHVEIRFGASPTAVRPGPGGVAVDLADGTTIDADLLVGADGLHSQVRTLCFVPEAACLRPLGARVAAFLLDRDVHPLLPPDTSHSLTGIGRAAALASASFGRLVAFFIWRTGADRPPGDAETELRHAFAGMGWQVPALLDLLPRAGSLYLDDVAQIVLPCWSAGRVVLLGDAACAVSLIAGKGATFALAGACLLADSLADRPADIAGACAATESWLRPRVERAQRTARRNLALFTPRNRFQLVARELALRLAATPLLAPLTKRVLDRQGERLPPR